ncbi:sulfite exporter TauE/SafE family protein [Sunxiuqinia indica]|uniref:sulfite exporter TauE/SafE family protein n=1 Tax=Sunxiuqinia indica TaxID=2692584 RepID=UPI00135BA2AA|nr:sulfite exporter TauE/SafE family protein [Sunxiuqinia indica]
MEWYYYFALVGVGLVAGIINAMAAGGSMLSLPFLIFLGLPANIANATNRVAILFQNIVGVNSFRQEKIFDLKTDYRLALPAVVGAIIGALFAVEIDPQLLEKIIGFVMFFMLLVIIFKPDAWLKKQVGVVNSKPSLIQYIVFFFIGMYGGFIQLGVGFLLLGGLVLGCGYDLVKANAIKLFIVLVYTIFAIVIFIFHDQIDWLSGLMLACGNMLGAWIGVKFTMKGGAKLVRYVLIVVLALITVKLLVGL